MRRRPRAGPHQGLPSGPRTKKTALAYQAGGRFGPPHDVVASAQKNMVTIPRLTGARQHRHARGAAQRSTRLPAGSQRPRDLAPGPARGISHRDVPRSSRWAIHWAILRAIPQGSPRLVEAGYPLGSRSGYPKTDRGHRITEGGVGARAAGGAQIHPRRHLAVRASWLLDAYRHFRVYDTPEAATRPDGAPAARRARKRPPGAARAAHVPGLRARAHTRYYPRGPEPKKPPSVDSRAVDLGHHMTWWQAQKNMVTIPRLTGARQHRHARGTAERSTRLPAGSQRPRDLAPGPARGISHRDVPRSSRWAIHWAILRDIP